MAEVIGSNKRTAPVFKHSIDVGVWPSVDLPFQGWIGPSRPFWSELSALVTELQSSEHRVGSVEIVEALIVVDSLSQLFFQEFPCGFEPAHLVENVDPSSDNFLGFDIADAWFLSGLLNIERTEKEWLRVSKTLGLRLNENGLVRRVEDALVFREYCQVEVPEHAPFFCYALRRCASEEFFEGC